MDKTKIGKAVGKIVVIMAALICYYPVMLTVTNSFMGKTEVFYRYVEKSKGITLIPSKVVFYEYYDVLISRFEYLQAFWNSCLYSAVITVFALAVSVLAAFAFHNGRFVGKEILLFLYVVIMMMPLQVTLMPNYIGLREMHLLDTRWAIILPAVFNPFPLFLMYQYMGGIPNDCIEAARMETNSALVVLLKVIVPQVKTCVFAVIVFIFAETWNMIEQPFIYLKRESLLPLSIRLRDMFLEEIQLGLAGGVIFIVPILLLYLFFGESLEKGLEHMSFEVIN